MDSSNKNNLPIKLNRPKPRGWSKYAAPQSDKLVEQLRDIGQGTVQSLKEDLLFPASKDILRQVLGFEKPSVRASGELVAGQAIEIDAVLAAQQEENRILSFRLMRENQLREADKIANERKTNDLRLQLQAITSEVTHLAVATKDLSEEVKVAAMEAPVNPGIYHIVFFEKLLSFIKSFRKKIQNASLWLHSQNQISAKRRRFWGQVGLSGAKRLLSSEDYIVRSAG